MTPEEFARRIREFVYPGIVEDTLSLLGKPPGRKPSPLRVELSTWFVNLSDADKTQVKRVIQFSVHAALFEILAILDGASFLEGLGSKGRFELQFIKEGRSVLINDPEAEFLHDLFNVDGPPV